MLTQLYSIYLRLELTFVFDKFIPKCRHSLKEMGLSQKALLVLDYAHSHPNIETLSSEDGHINCLFLPPNTTSLLQPGVLQAIKKTYKHDFLPQMLDGDDMNIPLWRTSPQAEFLTFTFFPSSAMILLVVWSANSDGILL